MKYRLLVLVALLVPAFFLGQYAYHSFFRSGEEEKPSETLPSEKRRLPPPTDTSTGLRSNTEPVDLADPEFAPPDGLAKSDELLLTFPDDASYRRFLESAERNGIQIIGRNDILTTARLRVENSETANRIREIAGDDASMDYNYIVAAPTIPQPSSSGRTPQVFENQALEWLGVPKDNAHWGEGITIAVLDTGISDHFILGDSKIARQVLVESNDNPDSEYNGHGTAIASILIGEEGLGIAPAANLISIQVMDSNGLGDSFTLAEGIIEAVDAGASIISMSLGSYGYTSILENAVAYALSKNVALVASAGNDGANIVPYPAQFYGVIGVAAIDAESQRADFSNYSPSVDIAAPGVGVFAAWGEKEWISFSGTSAAAPYVSGSIAATLSLNPRLTPQEAASIILDYADDGGVPGIDVETGNGVLNIDRVLYRDEPNIYDAAIGDFYLDLEQATESAIPLLVTVQNRGTERLSSVSVEIIENDGIPQKVYLGSLVEKETTTHTIYLDPGQLTSESGYSIRAETLIAGRDDSRTRNDTKTGTLQLPSPEP